MKAVGIIAEYNPFHNGHAYHIACAKRLTSADVVIAIMSGNFTQRGVPAVCDKWERAKVALANGVDIVVELPTRSAVQAADYFGYEAVKIANHFGVSMLSFGVESGDAADFLTLAEMSQAASGAERFDLSYHDNMLERMRVYARDKAELLQKPNNQLGFSYAKAVLKQNVDMTLYPVKRLVAQHTDSVLAHHHIASATAIRQAVDKKIPIASYVPEQMVSALSDPIDLEAFWRLVQYAVVSQTPEELRMFYQVDEGIEYRLLDCAKRAKTYEEFIHLAKHKRFKIGRIQRMVLYILLRVTKQDMLGYFEKSVTTPRVLGASANGIVYLKQLGKQHYTTQLKGAHMAEYQSQLNADKIYEMMMPHPIEQNLRAMIRG